LKVLPDQPAKHYQLVINNDKRKKGTMTEHLPLENVPLIQPAIVDPDGIILAGAEQPPPLPEAPNPKAVGTGSKRRATAKPQPHARVQPIEAGGAPPGGTGGAGGEGGGDGGGGCPPVPGDPDGILLGGAGPEPGEAPVASGAELRAPPRPQVHACEFTGLFGMTLRWQPYITPGGKSYPNFVASCTRHIPPCHKTKGMTPKNTREHGEIQPLSFLHAWNDYDDPAGIKTHGQVDPPPALVSAMAAEHGQELRAIMDSNGFQA